MQLIGLARVGRDAELRRTTDGDAVIDLSLAFNYGRKTDGKKPTQWISAALWGKRAEALVDYLTKGTTLCVALDDPHVETYRKGDGTDGIRLSAKVASLEFATSPERAPAPPPPAPRPPAPAPRTAAPAPRATLSTYADMDDDVPF